MHVVFLLPDDTVLLDLKHLLMEAKQKVPPFLAAKEPENDEYLDIDSNNDKYLDIDGNNDKYLDIDGNNDKYLDIDGNW